MAKGAAARGKRIAFGDGKTITWDFASKAIFAGNPNIAPIGSENDSDIEWIHFCRGHRIYNEHDHSNNRWKWNYDFIVKPGEIFFNAAELRWAEQFGKDFIVVERNVPDKAGVINKQWPKDRYGEVIKSLSQSGHSIVELYNSAPSFRHALAVLSRAALYLGSEGGLHHGAAAVGIPAVVIFGSWIPPQVTGYQTHTNLVGGATKFCGRLFPCDHCKSHLEKITVDEVHEAAMALL